MMFRLGALAAPMLLTLALTPAGLLAGPVNGYIEHNLVSDVPGFADNFDANLSNPWGIAFSPTSPFWVADNHTGLATVYNGAGQPFPTASPLKVTIPPPNGGTPPAAPTGQIFNNTQDFQLGGKPSSFIFSTEDGTISAWNGGSSATLEADNSASGAVYKGLALGSNASGNFLFATNFNSGKIDVFNKSFSQVNLAGSFTDPNLPAGYAPFGIENIGGSLYVTFALQNGAKHDDVAGPGNGYIDVFDTNGNLVRRLASGGALNSPWGLTVAPASFGAFGGDLLVGNFGDGSINAFDPTSGQFLGTLDDTQGKAVAIPGLWGLTFGNGANAGSTNTLYFTAGIPGPPPGMVEDHGLFGSLQTVPEPGSLLLLGSGLIALALRRRGGIRRY